jgi:outer membrane protein assembly factor BamD (BamD/ComL family)
LGVGFVFNPNTKILHYDGAAWKEILTRFPKSPEVGEAQKRLDSLKEKLERKL